MKVVLTVLVLMISFVVVNAFNVARVTTNRSVSHQEPRMELESLKTKAMTVLTIMDTAKTTAEIGPGLAKNYAEIGLIMKANQLSYAGMPLAWYHSQTEPFIVEAGIPIEKKPARVSGRVKVKQVVETDAVVVHFWGPYEMTAKAYPLIRKWLEQNNKTAAGAPYDVYVTDPTTVKDPYQIQTDIYQPFK